MLTNQIRAWLSGEGEGEEEGGILEVMVPSVFNKRMGQKFPTLWEGRTINLTMEYVQEVEIQSKF